jgi:antitoxin component YwqK of YwqJK toxin-antitoxin module
MKKYILYLFLGLLMTSCSEETKPEVKTTGEEKLIEIVDGIYTEYYPGKKEMRIQGEQDDNGQRNGKWSFFNENGKELSYTFFKNGKKHGFSYNSYPNGAPFYYGEYYEDEMIGIWKTYDQMGVMTEKEYGYPEKK